MEAEAINAQTLAAQTLAAQTFAGQTFAAQDPDRTFRHRQLSIPSQPAQGQKENIMELPIGKRAGCLFLFILAFMADGLAHGQVERNELGKRLQRFELQWDQASAAARVAAAAPMQDAVSSFFSLRLQRAAQGLDAAYWQALGTEPSPANQSILAHRLAVEPLVVGHSATITATRDSDNPTGEPLPATTTHPLKLKLTAFYPAEPVPASAQVEFTLVPRGNGIAIQRLAPAPSPLPPLNCTWAAAESGLEWDVTAVPDGDYEVHTRVTCDGETLTLLPTGWSRVAGWNDRLAALEKDLERWSDPGPDVPPTPTWIVATVKDYRRVLDGLSQGEVPEIDYPAYRLLQDGEALLAALATAPTAATPDVAGGSPAGSPSETPAVGRDPVTLWRERATQADLWMTVAQGRRRVPLRLRSPAGWDRQTALPILILFHGAGGSENMFFETYGAGGAVQAGLDRGWLVVATRQALTGLSLDAAQILDELGQIFPLDRQRVYYLGHSMGAGQVATQVGQHPELPLAVAAIGGGGRPRNLAAAARVPWYVAAGSLDFGKSGARSLSQSLQRAGGQQITYQEFPDVEHMVIVQAALAEAFEFFDKQKK